MLSHGKSYRHNSDERIAYKYYTRSWQLDEAQRKGMTRPQFMRYYQIRLGEGADLQRVTLDPKHPHRLASESEILEIMADLQPPGKRLELSLKKRDELRQEWVGGDSQG